MDDLSSTAARGWRGPAEPSGRASVTRNLAKNTRTFGLRCVRTKRSERIDLRANAAEIAALDYLAFKWSTSHCDVIQSFIVGAALSELDRLDALDAIEPSFDALVDVPSIDDVLAGT